MSTIRVQTTQNVTLEYEVASAGDRVLATIIDNVVMGAWGLVVFMVAASLGISKQPATIFVLMGLVGVPVVFYHLLCEVYFNGQSVGKKARDIRVVRLDGTTPSFGDYLLRWILRLIDTALMGGVIALVVVLLNGKGQRLGDLAAGTAVISTRPRQAAGALAPAFTEPGYVVVFAEAARLADHDVATIRQLLQKSAATDNYVLLHELAIKIKELTSIQTDLPDEAFVRTVLRDHAHLAAQEGPHA